MLVIFPFFVLGYLRRSVSSQIVQVNHSCAYLLSSLQTQAAITLADITRCKNGGMWFFQLHSSP